VLLRKLKDDWNPDFENATKTKYTFVDSLNDGLKNKEDSTSKKTYNEYSSSIKSIITVINEINIGYKFIEDVKRADLRNILRIAKKNNNWSNHNYNKRLDHLSAVLSELVDLDILEYNPAHKIKKLPVSKNNKYRTPTNEEHKKIKENLKAIHPYFCNYVEAEYHTGARPFELLEIQLHMIDLPNREINLPPEITKGKIKSRDIIVNDYLFNMLSNMNLKQYPQDFYLFGSFRQKGKGNKGKHIDFIPGTTKIKRDTATKRWNRIVINGLNIKVHLYAYKHKGGDDKVINGVDLDSIREGMGHSDTRMTKTYVKKIQGVYKKDIIDNSPEF